MRRVSGLDDGWQVARGDRADEIHALVGAVAKRRVGGLTAAAESDGGASAETKGGSCLIDDFKITFDANRTVVEDRHFSAGHECLRQKVALSRDYTITADGTNVNGGRWRGVKIEERSLAALGMTRYLWIGLAEGRTASLRDSGQAEGGPYKRLIPGNVRVDFGGPGQDAAAEIGDFAEASLAEEVDGLSGTFATLAMSDDFARGIEFVDASRKFAERNQVAAEIADLIFVRVADIEDEDVFAAIEFFFQLARSDFRNVEIALGLFFAADAAELVVVDEFMDFAMRSAHGAVRILAELEFAELHGESVKENEATLERIALADNELDGFKRLKRADDAGEHTENAAFGARGNEAGGRGFGIEATIAGAVGHAEDSDLALEAEDGAVDVGLAEEDAGVVDEVAGGEVVGAVDDYVVILEEFESVGAGEFGLVGGDLDVGIEIGEARFRGFGFGLADIAGAEGDLALEIGEVDDIEINQTDVSYARGSEIKAEGRAEPACADEKDFGAFQLELTVHADFGHDEVAAVAEDFFVGEARCRRGAGQRLRFGGHECFPTHSLLGHGARWKNRGAGLEGIIPHRVEPMLRNRKVSGLKP